MRHWLPIVLLVGCGIDEEVPTTERDVAEVGDLVEAIQPARVVALALHPELALQLDGDACREYTLDTDTLIWSGPCALQDGAQLEGNLSLRPTDDGLLLSADGLSISQGGRIEVMLSGAIELTRWDDLVQLDVSIQGCGAVGPSCDKLDDGDSFGLDLDYSLYPADTFPSLYTATVSGAVGRTETIVGVEGTWQVDQEQCAEEAIDGTIAFGTFPRQTLELDGASACDGCAGWRVEGVEVPALCEVEGF